MDEWYNLWAERLELESSKDPGRLGNFRALREEEKRRNRVNKRLPKVVEEIKKLTENFQLEHDKTFLIKGKLFSQINDDQQTNHAIDVKNEKERKKQERKQMLVQETIYGVQTKTPIKNKNMSQVKRLKNFVKPVGKVLNLCCNLQIVFNSIFVWFVTFVTEQQFL